MFGQENDLSGVLRILRDLPIGGLQNGMWFAANRHRAHDVLWFECFDARENTRPALLPPSHYVGASCGPVYFGFLVAIAIRRLAVGSQEVCKPRPHIASQMFDQNCD